MNHLIPSPRAGTWHALALFFVFVCSFSVPRASGQGTAFTYQGRLTDNGNPANGAYDLVASLFAASSGGNAVAGPVTNSPVNVSNGLFSIALDFGGNFPGADRWLEIGARAAGVGDFVPLAPRQKIMSAPYAVTARNVTGVLPSAGLTGTYSGAVTFNNSANAFTGNGSGLSGVNAISLGGLSAIQFWRTGGNSGTSPNTAFLGTTDNQPLEVRVNGLRALRLQPNTNAAPNLIAGSSSNLISAGTSGATIAGGHRNFIESFPFAGSDFAFLGGGASNQIGYFSFNSVIGGGFQNVLDPNDYFSFIGGGLQNHMGFHAVHSVISGGRSNFIENSVDTATIAGGAENAIGFLAHYTGIGAGQKNMILSNAQYSVISGGRDNLIGSTAAYSHIGGGERNRVLDGAHGTIAGGGANSINAYSGTIVGGTGNSIETNSYEAFIGGGNGNIIHTNAERATIAGGVFHEVGMGAGYSFIGGGTRNKAGNNAVHATISGGSNSTIDRDTSYGFIGGIQGLNQKLQEELKRRDEENRELKERVAALERLVRAHFRFLIFDF